MTIVSSYGREPGYPKYKESLANKKVTATYQDRRKVIVTDEFAIGEQVMAALPTDFAIGSYLAGSAICRLKDRSLERDNEARNLYFLDLSYTSELDDEQNDDQNKPPDQRKAEWAWDFETVDLLFTKDVDTGAGVKNSADEPFEITTEYCIPVLTIERWQVIFDPSDIINFVNHRNEKTFWGADPGTAIIAGIRDRKDTQEVFRGVSYRKVTFTIKFKIPFLTDKIEGWKEILMDIGTRYKGAAADTTYKTLLSSGQRDKVKLNTDGTKRGASEDPLYLKFNRFPKADFDELTINHHQI